MKLQCRASMMGIPELEDEIKRQVQGQVIDACAPLRDYKITLLDYVRCHCEDHPELGTIEVTATRRTEGQWLSYLHARRAGILACLRQPVAGREVVDRGQDALDKVRPI